VHCCLVQEQKQAYRGWSFFGCLFPDVFLCDIPQHPQNNPQHPNDTPTPKATSALDVESERVVQAALDSLVVGRTTVVSARCCCGAGGGVVGPVGFCPAPLCSALIIPLQFHHLRARNFTPPHTHAHRHNHAPSRTPPLHHRFTRSWRTACPPSKMRTSSRS